MPKLHTTRHGPYDNVNITWHSGRRLMQKRPNLVCMGGRSAVILLVLFKMAEGRTRVLFIFFVVLLHLAMKYCTAQSHTTDLYWSVTMHNLTREALTMFLCPFRLRHFNAKCHGSPWCGNSVCSRRAVCDIRSSSQPKLTMSTDASSLTLLVVFFNNCSCSVKRSAGGNTLFKVFTDC